MGYAGIKSTTGFEKYVLAKADILMSHINSEKHLGKVALFPGGQTIIHGMNLLCLRPNPLILLSQFAVLFFRHSLFEAQLAKISKKSVNQASFSVSALKTLNIPLPPLEEQRRIVEILDAAQALIDQRKEQLGLMDQLVQSLFYEMFGDPVTNPMGWEFSTLGTLFRVKTGKTPARKEMPYWENGEIPWVKTTEVNGELILDSDEKITKLGLRESNLELFPEGTILIAMYGQGRTRGRVAILGIKAATNQACAALVPADHIVQEYVFRFLSLSYLQLRRLGRGGNQPNLNLSLVSGFQIPRPPIELQTQFAERVEAIEVQKAAMVASLVELETTFQALMQRAFKGELTG